ncbi:MAG: D-ribose pyranase [Comamonas sp.]|uniref:D-ribose pyranase n=1 Tax=Comamonas TaxID=283 RepID=UPI000EB4F84C|nr:D-ribose pyranase [Comamonas sp. lk]
MKKALLLNAPLTAVIARMGHGDRLVIGDAGLPIPAGVERIDLAVSAGIPAIADVLKAVAAEMQVERVVLAQETLDRSDVIPGWLPAEWAQSLAEPVSHEEFKRQCATARAVVRTGECTPYANVMLIAGVTF